MCVQGKHKAVESSSSGGDRGQVGAHGLTRSRVTIPNVHTEVKENKKYTTLDNVIYHGQPTPTTKQHVMVETEN